MPIHRLQLIVVAVVVFVRATGVLLLSLVVGCVVAYVVVAFVFALAVQVVLVVIAIVHPVSHLHGFVYLLLKVYDNIQFPPPPLSLA